MQALEATVIDTCSCADNSNKLGKVKRHKVLENDLSERDRDFLRQIGPDTAVLFYPDGKRVMYSLSREMADEMVRQRRARVKSKDPYYIISMPTTREDVKRD